MELPDNAGTARRDAMAQLRRELMIDAAKAVFARHGIEGTSLRKIAQAAGATTGAIFSHYRSKQELYADVLCDSMATLTRELEAARDTAKAGRQAEQVLVTVLAFYQARPNDFDLSFYLFGGTEPGTLGRELDRRLNGQMQGVIALVGAVLAEDSLAPAADSFRYGVAAMAHVFGVTLMFKTGRLKALRQDPRELIAIYVRSLVRQSGSNGED